MGVYNPYRNKPKHCYDCELNNGRYCFANDENLIDISSQYALNKMHDDCPLVDIPGLKQIKYFDEDENVWKVGSVIVNE